MNVGLPVFMAGLTVFAIAVAWIAATAITSLQTRRKGPMKSERPAIARLPAPFKKRAWVLDGETIRVGKHRVRLFGMDAPEMDQRGGAEAKSNLILLAGGTDFQVESLTMDCYGRVVAKVWRGDKVLSERMVHDGFAVATSRWNRDNAPAEREARAERRGLWAFDSTNGIEDPATHRASIRRSGAVEHEKPRSAGLTPRRPWPEWSPAPVFILT